jgi:CRISPR-associated protein Csb1
VCRDTAIRLSPDTQILVPLGGPATAIAPALYGKMEARAQSDEHRRWSSATKSIFYGGRHPATGEATTCVVINSVAAEANLFEAALEDVRNEGWPVPDVEIDFPGACRELADLGRFGSLRVPHRGYDALLRDSTLYGIPFAQSEIGRSLVSATVNFATPLLLLPHMAILGAWHTQGTRGGAGSKIGRAMVSEIVGYGAAPAVACGGRIDPTGIDKTAVVYKARNATGVLDWTSVPEEAEFGPDGKPVMYPTQGKKAGQKPGSPSLVLHGNILPVAESRGATIEGAVHSMLLSLASLRRLDFPMEIGERATSARNEGARTALAALAVVGMVERLHRQYHVRSRCDLVPLKAPCLEVVGKSLEDMVPFEIDAEGARSLLDEAVGALEEAGITWGVPAGTTLIPDPRVINAIKLSRARLSSDDDTDDTAS